MVFTISLLQKSKWAGNYVWGGESSSLAPKIFFSSVTKPWGAVFSAPPVLDFYSPMRALMSKCLGKKESAGILCKGKQQGHGFCFVLLPPPPPRKRGAVSVFFFSLPLKLKRASVREHTSHYSTKWDEKKEKQHGQCPQIFFSFATFWLQPQFSHLIFDREIIPLTWQGC